MYMGVARGCPSGEVKVGGLLCTWGWPLFEPALACWTLLATWPSKHMRKSGRMHISWMGSLTDYRLQITVLVLMGGNMKWPLSCGKGVARSRPWWVPRRACRLESLSREVVISAFALGIFRRAVCRRPANLIVMHCSCVPQGSEAVCPEKLLRAADDGD
jgi:hypothetical protein